MNLEYYKTFYKVATEKSITKAAKALFISQPAVSKTIKTLEEHLKCPLFVRTSSGVVLTDEGETLYNQLTMAFSHIEAGENMIKKHIELNKGVIKVGISNTLCKYIFIPLLSGFHQAYPDIQIEVCNRSSIETSEMVKRGLLDFALISTLEHEDQLHYQPFMEIEDVVVTSDPNSPFLGGPIGVEYLKVAHLMMLEKGNTTRQQIDTFLTDNTLFLEPQLEIGNMEFLIEFAKIGIGEAFVIKNFVEDELKSGELFEINIKPKPPARSIAVISLSDIPTSKASQAFIEYILSKSTYHS